MIIGLTGGIASGKSTVANAFAELGIGWVDADHIAREVVEPGEPALAEILARHGPSIIDASGQLKRSALRAIVFADEEERRWLESVTHPRIRDRLYQRLDGLLASRSPYVLLVSPLLFESGQVSMVDRCLVIDVPENIQIARTCQRDDVDENQARAIIAAQMPRAERLSRADDVIVNDGDLTSLTDQVANLDRRYRDIIAHSTLPPER
ncbi:dephospho-CoA kinase [Halomonas cupida]|uniref:Dephospho-CoA kinase n=1 Tax=Halomonas cupida TaxID=44933 RepID=A0A1M7MS59_9GAMM|nr:dephospho-CoA kinase [Halomonas cupida]GEN25989.1 dephospho-CoA kinase [Halomonas cupida]SHM93360.1 dephospho-CoA kinase [Halomonas cupida]